MDNIQLTPHTTVSYTARLASTEQPKETIYKVTPREEGIPRDEEEILVESMMRKNGKGNIPVMLANLGNKTVKVTKGEKLGDIWPLNIRKQVKYTEKWPTKIIESIINSQDINVPEEYRKKIEDLIQNNRDVIANSD